MTYFGGDRPCQMAVEWPEMAGIMPYTLHSKRKGLSFQTHTFGACKNKKKRNKHIFSANGTKKYVFFAKKRPKMAYFGVCRPLQMAGEWPEMAGIMSHPLHSTRLKFFFQTHTLGASRNKKNRKYDILKKKVDKVITLSSFRGNLGGGSFNSKIQSFSLKGSPSPPKKKHFVRDPHGTPKFENVLCFLGPSCLSERSTGFPGKSFRIPQWWIY